MADHDIEEEVDNRPLKESLFDSISSDRDWLSKKNDQIKHIIATKEKMLAMMEANPIIEEWFKLYREITERR